MKPQDTLLADLERVVEHHSGALARAAQFVIENPERVVRLSLAEFAQAAKVGQATVVRMGREAGVAGFSELKISLAGDLARRRASDPPIEEGTDDPLRGIEDVMTRSMSETRRLIDPDALARVAERLAAAERIDIFGMGVSGTVAELIAYRLLRLGYPIVTVRDPVAAREVAAGLGPRSAVIAVSQSGATLETLRFVTDGRQMGAFTLALTAYPRSAVAKAADTVILLGRFGRPHYGGLLIDVPRAVLAGEALALALPPRRGEAP